MGDKKPAKSAPKVPTSKKTLKGSKKLGHSKLMVRFD